MAVRCVYSHFSPPISNIQLTLCYSIADLDCYRRCYILDPDPIDRNCAFCAPEGPIRRARSFRTYTSLPRVEYDRTCLVSGTGLNLSKLKSVYLSRMQIVLLTHDYRLPGQSLGQALIRAPPFWLVSVMTMSIILPWIRLRKVPVRAEVLSPHAVRLYFDYG